MAPAFSSPSITDADTPVAPTSAAFAQAMPSIRQSSTRRRAGVIRDGSTPVSRKPVTGRSASSASGERSTERSTMPGGASV